MRRATAIVTTKIQQPRSMGDRPLLMRLGYLMIFILITAVMGFAIFQPIKVLPRLSLAPGYSFVNQEGKRFTSESLRGSLILYTFSHSQCTSPCIPTSATLASLRSELTDVPTGDIPLQFVTIFVDPEQTTPTALHAQADRLGVYANDWHLVTGDSAQLKHVIGSGFSTYYAHDANGSFTVDPVFVLVDGWGIIRAVYRTAAPDVATIKRDLRLVAQEVLKSTGVNRVAYEAAHLFLCYPKS